MDALLKNMVRIGVISSVNPKDMKARVLFEERDVVSAELDIVVQGSLHNTSYWLPQINEQVLCLFLATGNQKGFILGSLYNKTDVPKINNVNKIRHDFKDGSFVEHDHTTGDMLVQATGNVTIKARKITLVEE